MAFSHETAVEAAVLKQEQEQSFTPQTNRKLNLNTETEWKATTKFGILHN